MLKRSRAGRVSKKLIIEKKTSPEGVPSSSSPFSFAATVGDDFTSSLGRPLGGREYLPTLLFGRTCSSPI